MASFPFQVVTPERTVLQGDAEMLALRSAAGDIAFLADHVPYIGEVEIGVVRAQMADEVEQVAAVHGGFVEVRKDGDVVVVAGVAELPEEIDVQRAEAARQRAESALGGADEHPAEEAALERAQARLAAAAAGGAARQG